ncbi:MAG: hypothetical protein ACREPP_08970, partial [Rhodanobacteraceae bacterium]
EITNPNCRRESNSASVMIVPLMLVTGTAFLDSALDYRMVATPDWMPVAQDRVTGRNIGRDRKRNGTADLPQDHKLTRQWP